MRDQLHLRRGPELALNSSLMLAEPTNFIQVVLNGVTNGNCEQHARCAGNDWTPLYLQVAPPGMIEHWPRRDLNPWSTIAGTNCGPTMQECPINVGEDA